MAATLWDTANFDNNCVATPETYRRGYNFRLSSLFLLKLASIAGENMGKTGSMGSQKMDDFCVAPTQCSVKLHFGRRALKSSHFLTSKADSVRVLEP